MASNTSSSVTLTAFKKASIIQPEESEEEEEIDEEHPFSEPWEESDLVLVVEDEVFHVHRQILSIHSPVFKAMLNSQFKEAASEEIPLPGKKPNEILDFLKQMYLKERDGITLNKVEHLLKLADEYQAVSVFNLCVKCLKDEPKSQENAVKILFLANSTVMAKEDHRLDSVRGTCYGLIKDMEHTDVVRKKDFKNLDCDSLENVYVQRTERLEKFLKRIYPQVIGLVEYCLFLCLESRSINRCPEHYPSASTGFHPASGNKANGELFERIKSCTVCRKMILQLVSASKETHGNKEHRYGGIHHFDYQLISLILDFKTIIKPDVLLVGTLPTALSGFQFASTTTQFAAS